MLEKLTASPVSMKTTVKKELGLGEDEVEGRLTQLATLLPGLLARLPTIKFNTVVLLAQDTSVSSCELDGSSFLHCTDIYASTLVALHTCASY